MGSKEEESQQNEPREKSKTTEKPANSQVIKCEMTLKTLEQLEKLPMRSKWRHVLQRLYVESHLEVLDMQDSGVTLEVIRCLYDYLSYINTPLIHLNLSRNAIGPKGVKLLGKALVTNNCLQFVEIEGCDLVGSNCYRPNHEGILSLVKGIESVRTNLRYLNLANNNLMPEGCRILCSAVCFHPTLTALNLSGNLAGLFNDKQAYMAISYLLGYNTHLCHLDISNNSFPRNSLPFLKNGLKQNKSLTYLNVSNCEGFKEHQLFQELPSAQQALFSWIKPTYT